MTLITIPVTLLLGEHLVDAVIMTAGQRLLEVLNNTLTDYLPLSGVQIHHAGQGRRQVAESGKVLIRKDSVVLAIITSEKREAQDKRMFSFIQKRPTPVLITVPGYEIRGLVHLSFPVDPMAFLVRDTGNFVPVTEASVVSVDGDVLAQRAQTVMVRKQSIGLLYLEENL